MYPCRVFLHCLAIAIVFLEVSNVLYSNLQMEVDFPYKKLSMEDVYVLKLLKLMFNAVIVRCSSIMNTALYYTFSYIDSVTNNVHFYIGGSN